MMNTSPESEGPQWHASFPQVGAYSREAGFEQTFEHSAHRSVQIMHEIERVIRQECNFTYNDSTIRLSLIGSTGERNLIESHLLLDLGEWLKGGLNQGTERLVSYLRKNWAAPVFVASQKTRAVMDISLSINISSTM